MFVFIVYFILLFQVIYTHILSTFRMSQTKPDLCECVIYYYFPVILLFWCHEISICITFYWFLAGSLFDLIFCPFVMYYILFYCFRSFTHTFYHKCLCYHISVCECVIYYYFPVILLFWCHEISICITFYWFLVGSLFDLIFCPFVMYYILFYCFRSFTHTFYHKCLCYHISVLLLLILSCVL